MKKAAFLVSRIMKDFLIPKIESMMQTGKYLSHSAIAKMTELAFGDPTKHGIRLIPQNCDYAYPPVIQSGGKYDLKISSKSNDMKLKEDCIVCMLGARYEMYCGNYYYYYLVI